MKSLIWIVLLPLMVMATSVTGRAYGRGGRTEIRVELQGLGLVDSTDSLGYFGFETTQIKTNKPLTIARNRSEEKISYYAINGRMIQRDQINSWMPKIIHQIKANNLTPVVTLNKSAFAIDSLIVMKAGSRTKRIPLGTLDTAMGDIILEYIYETIQPCSSMVEISNTVTPSKPMVFKMYLYNIGTDTAWRTVKLTDAYFIDTTEITQKEWVSLMGYNPSKVVGDNLPVTNVSWYDAALYCNARSKKYGLDTVYQYSGFQYVSWQGSDSVYFTNIMTDLIVHDYVYGYRLPTVAEYMYICTKNGVTTPWWNANYEWCQESSWGEVHGVAEKLPHIFFNKHLYDLAGNVSEMLNDQPGLFYDTTVIDPIGPDSVIVHYPSSYTGKLYRTGTSGGSNYKQSISRFTGDMRNTGKGDMGYYFSETMGFRVAIRVFYLY